MSEENKDKKVEDSQPSKDNIVPKEKMDEIKNQLEKDIKDTQDKLVSGEVKKEISEAAERAREQAKVEFEKDKLAEEQRGKIKELEDQLKAKEKESHDKIEELKNRVDEMTTSKAVYTKEDNPFLKDKINVDTMNNEELRAIEEESKRLFFEQKGK